MNSPKDVSLPSRAPRSGLQLMVLIVVALGGLAVYSNVQKARRDQIETVTVTPVGAATPSPSPATR